MFVGLGNSTTQDKRQPDTYISIFIDILLLSPPNFNIYNPITINAPINQNCIFF